MSDDTKAAGGVAFVEIKRHLLDSARPPKLAHKFMYSRIEDQVFVSVGHFEGHEVHAFLHGLKGEEDPEPPRLHITDTFVLNIKAAQELRRTTEEMFAELQASGLIEPAAKKEAADDAKDGA